MSATEIKPRTTDYRLRATREYRNFIDGEWVESSSGKTFEDINPADRDDIVGTFQESKADDLNRAVEAADRANQSWRLVPAPKRAEYLYAVGAVLKRDRSEEHTSELQSPCNLVCRLLLEKKKRYKRLMTR